MPIDFVITWVDGSNPEWYALKQKYTAQSVWDDDAKVRYRNWDNLQYWFRAVEAYAPWVNRIHFVTWGDVPQWLNTANPKLHIVKHRDFIPEEYLPSFNSTSIEHNLHRIEGLEEQFVYFNDDMFLNSPTRPEDFFVDGKPCDLFALDCICCGKGGVSLNEANNIAVINDHFSKKEEFRKNRRNWLRLRYGIKRLYRTVVLMPWTKFPGLYRSHLPSSFLKSTFEAVWAAEPEILDESCKHRIRSKHNLNQWLYSSWQLASGNFYPRAWNAGTYYEISDDSMNEILCAIREHRGIMICINDTEGTTNFQENAQQLKETFQSVFPKKSSFEL